MSDLTLHNLDDHLLAGLGALATRHGRTMEEEACALLRAAVPPRPTTGAELLARIRSRFEPLGGVDLELPPRDLPRPPPDFSA